ncbi:MAG: PAS domain-containing protein [Deltaproteobacteria bacterium]|nr:PAS domain-containing protein [Deltaproteobacteria bacterium]
MGIFKETSLQKKITWVIMSTALTTLLLAVGALFILEVGEFRDSMTRELNSIAGVIGANSEAALEFDDPKAGAQTLHVLSEDPRVIAAALYDEHNRIFATYLSAHAQGDIPSSPGPYTSVIDEEGLSLFRPITHEGRRVGSIYIHSSSGEVYARLIRHAGIASLILLLCGIAAYFISLRLREVVSRPILNLAETARRVSELNDYSIRAVKTSQDETGALVDQFNKMLEEIGKKSRDLEEGAHQLRLITNSVPALIAYVDREERYQFNNAEYEKWFNRPLQNLKGQRVCDVFGAEYDNLREHIQSALNGNRTHFEQRLSFPAAQEKFISSVYIPDIDDEGSTQGFFALITDITERKRAENELKVLNDALEQRVSERTRELEQSQEKLRHSERLASIGTLAAGVAHEIRNPLNSILLVAQYALRYRSDLDNELKDMLKNVTNEAKRCATIIKNILLFAKAEKTERSAQDINVVIRHATDIARGYFGSSRLQISLELDRQALPVLINSTEIEQVLINLINNAAEAGGSDVRILISTERSGDCVKLKVTDNGPGIPEEIMKHIFDPFFSTKRRRGNTGLGLSLSHGIVADHGGNLSVTSQVAVGTTFLIDLPIERSHDESSCNR